MKSSVYRQINYEYEQKRKRAHDSIEKLRSEIYKKNDRLAEIDTTISNLGISLSKALLLDAAKANEYIIELNQKIEKLKLEKKQILLDLGYSLDSLTPKYECHNCNDTGYISNDTEQTICSCFKQKLLNVAYKQSNLHSLDKENFDTFNDLIFSNTVNKEAFGIDISPRQNIQSIRQKCLEFLHSFDSIEEKNLLFTGSTGLGKTFLSNCIAKEILDKGKTVLYQTSANLIQTIMDYKMKSNSNEYFDEESYNEIFEVDLLIIDDFGTESLNDMRRAEIFSIINTRLLSQQRKHSKMIISTNYSLKDMYEHYEQRVISRILGNFSVLKFFGDDLRVVRKG